MILHDLMRSAGVTGCPFHHTAPRLVATDVAVPEDLAHLPTASSAPRVPGLPLLGNGLQLLRDPYGWWARQYQTHGPVFRLKLPQDTTPWIALAGKEANELLAKEGHRLFSQALTYPKAKEVLQTELHPSITEGELQRHLRRVVASGFTRQAAEPHLPQMLQVTRALVDELQPGQGFNVTEVTSRLGLNAMSIYATGEPIGHDTDPIRQYASVFTGVIAMGWPMAIMRWPSVRRTREGLDDMIARRMARHLAEPAGEHRPPDTFDAILRGTLPDGSPLPERVRVVYGQIPFKNMGVYAGRVLNHVLYQLVTRPDVLARVLPELDRVLGADEVTLESLQSMKVFRAAIKETLRVLPIAVAVQRTVVQPFAFGGYRFEPGDKLFFPISATHFLEEHFADPERFDVDRFLDDDGERYAYNPFGVGHHGCVARGLFETITLVTVGSMLRKWTLDAPYALRTIVDALPGPWPWHRMSVVQARVPAAAPHQVALAEATSLPARWWQALGDQPEVTLATGDVLFRAGDAPDRLYVVLEGAVDVHTADDTVLARLGPEEVVGEIGVLQGVPRTATVTARVPTRLLAIDGALFTDLAIELDVTARELTRLALRRHAAATLASALGASEAPATPKAGRVDAMQVAPGQAVLRQGDRAEHAFLLVSGSLEVTVTRPDGSTRVRATLQAPEIVGEVALLEGGTRTATVVAGRSGARLLRLDAQAFDDLSTQQGIADQLRSRSAQRALRAARTVVPA